jgi:branched-chain amino acid transport system substrate-binding protein
MKQWLAWMRRYYPEGDIADIYNVVGYTYAEALIHVLRQCNDDLSRENVMRQAQNLRDLESPVLIPGVKISTSPTDYVPVQALQLRRFDGNQWVRFGELIDLRPK